MTIKQLLALANSNIADFSMLDWSIFKVSLILFGVMLGCSFSSTCRSLRPVLFALWLAGILYTIKRVFNLPMFCCIGRKDKLSLAQKAPADTDQAAE